MWRIAAGVGGAPVHGAGVVPATTYPAFASLLTGAGPADHGVWVTGERPDAPAWARVQQVRLPTLLHAARARGHRAAAVLGDHLLGAVLGLDGDLLRWPPGGSPPAGTPLDAHGYAVNRAVVPHLLEAFADPSLALVFGHLNETDTIGHDHGPEAPETEAVARDTDALLGELLATLDDGWERTLVIITSDHDMEPIAALPLVDAPSGGVADGGAFVVRPEPGTARTVASALAETPGVSGVRSIGEWLIAGAEPGRVFAGSPRRPYRGIHGGPATARTLALVTGGHPAVAGLASRARGGMHQTEWAGAILTALPI